VRVDMPTDLQMLSLDVPYMTLFMEQLGQYTTTLLIARISPLFILF